MQFNFINVILGKMFVSILGILFRDEAMVCLTFGSTFDHIFYYTFSYGLFQLAMFPAFVTVD